MWCDIKGCNNAVCKDKCQAGWLLLIPKQVGPDDRTVDYEKIAREREQKILRGY